MTKKITISIGTIAFIATMFFAFAPVENQTFSNAILGSSIAAAWGDSGCANCNPQPTYPQPYYPNIPNYPQPQPQPQPQPKPKPVCSVYINPDQVNYGGSATISWTSANATSATVTDFGSEPVNGSRAISNITATKTYYVTVTGPGGSATCSDTVTVKKPPLTCVISANPSTINKGGSSTLTWSSNNAATASINQGVGGVAVNGSKSVSPQVTKTYTLTVYSNYPGQPAVTCHTTVTVKVPPNKPSCALTANPHSVQHGGSATLSWTSTNATSATINQGIGSVAVNGSKAVNNLTSTKTYTLTVTGPGGTATCQDTVTVQAQPQLPSCTLTINPHTVQYGGSATISWSSNNATSATLTDFGSEPVNGSRAITNITANKTYVLTVTGPGGTATCQDNIVVQQPNVPSCAININPNSVQHGGSATITWSSSNATSATLTDFGSEPVNGSRSITNITASKTYVLTVTGPGGTATCQDTIVVQQQETPFCTINANPSSLQYGGNSTLTWNSTNATSATINQGIGSVALNGSHVVSNIYTTKTYTMTVTGPGGSATCQTTIYVSELPSNPSCTISANPNSIQTGGSSYLSWTSQNAVSANLSNVGSVGVNGSYTVYPSGTTTYVLTVYAQNGQSAQCQTTVNLGIVYNNPPSCWITISTQYGYDQNYQNQQATLTWGSSNATSASINPNIGAVATHGSRSVYSAGNQVYTMTVYNAQGQSAICQTQHTQVPPFVALTQIPYTGLDLGTVGMMLYYFALLSVAFAALYLIVYYVPAFAGIKARIPAQTMEAPMIFARTVAASVPFSRAARSANSSGSVFKDSMMFARSEDGSTPRIVIQRS